MSEFNTVNQSISKQGRYRNAGAAKNIVVEYVVSRKHMAFYLPPTICG